MIPNSEISVVIQGPLKPETRQCILSVMRVLPGAEIIVSTWENSDFSILDGLSGFVLLENTDPNPNGKTYYNDIEKSAPFNLNRQIVSSYNGICAATRKYVLRMRADIELQSADFLRFWDAFPERNTDYAFFQHRIIVPSMISINPDFARGYFQIQISDWVQFGTKSDMTELYNLPQMNEYDMNFYLHNPNTSLPDGLIDNDSHCIWRWGSEQYLFVSNVKKKFSNLDYPHRCAVTDSVIETEKNFYINNFIVLDVCDFSFDNIKHPMRDSYFGWTSRFDWWETLYRYNLYQYDYKNYCDKDYKIKLNKFSYIFIRHILKSRVKFTTKIKMVIKVITEMILIKAGIKK